MTETVEKALEQRDQYPIVVIHSEEHLYNYYDFDTTPVEQAFIFSTIKSSKLSILSGLNPKAGEFLLRLLSKRRFLLRKMYLI